MISPWRTQVIEPDPRCRAPSSSPHCFSAGGVKWGGWLCSHYLPYSMPTPPTSAFNAWKGSWTCLRRMGLNAAYKKHRAQICWTAPVSLIAWNRKMLLQTGTPFRTQKALLRAQRPHSARSSPREEALVCFSSRIRILIINRRKYG